MSAVALLKTNYEDYGNPVQVKEMFAQFFLNDERGMGRIREVSEAQRAINEDVQARLV